MTTINFVRGHNKDESNWQIGLIGLIAVSLVALLLIIVTALLQSPAVLTNSNSPFTPNNPDDGVLGTTTLDGRLESIGGISSATYVDGSNVTVVGISGSQANGQSISASCAIDGIPDSWVAVGNGNYLVGSVSGNDGTTSLYYLGDSNQFLVVAPDGQKAIVDVTKCTADSVIKG